MHRTGLSEMGGDLFTPFPDRPLERGPAVLTDLLQIGAAFDEHADDIEKAPPRGFGQ